MSDINTGMGGREPISEVYYPEGQVLVLQQKLQQWAQWGGDYVHPGQFGMTPADCLGDIDEFLGDIMGAVGADSGDIFESYDPLLYTVANVVNETILGMLDHMTDEQIAAYNEDYCRKLERRG